MPSLLDQLNTADAPAAYKAIRVWAETASPRLDELLALVRLAPDLRQRLTTLTVVQGPGGPITWRQYEHVLWNLGEGFRQILKCHPTLRRNQTLFKAIAALCLEPANRKGRESFTMLLGQYGGPSQIPAVLALLDDPEVEGHALFALRTLKAPGGLDAAKRLLALGNAWKRGEAKKYLRRVYPHEVAT